MHNQCVSINVYQYVLTSVYQIVNVEISDFCFKKRLFSLKLNFKVSKTRRICLCSSYCGCLQSMGLAQLKASVQHGTSARGQLQPNLGLLPNMGHQPGDDLSPACSFSQPKASGALHLLSALCPTYSFTLQMVSGRTWASIQSGASA